MVSDIVITRSRLFFIQSDYLIIFWIQKASYFGGYGRRKLSNRVIHGPTCHWLLWSLFLLSYDAISIFFI